MPLHSTTLRYVVEVLYVVLRELKTVATGSEGEVHEKHDGLRAQKRPLPRTRPEPLAEVSEPQGPAATVGYVAARLPIIWWGPKLLADSSAEAINGRTLWYFLKKNLARKEEEEEERMRTQQDVAVAAAWPARWCCLFVPLGEEEEEREEQEKAPEGSSSSL